MKFETVYNDQKIEIEQSQYTGKEVIKINGKVVSVIKAAFKNNTYHKIIINGQFGNEDGFINIKTYFLDCLCVYRVVINSKLIETHVYKIPIEMNFRQLGLWVISMLIGAILVININKYFNLYQNNNIKLYSMIEMIFVLLFSYKISGFFGNKIGLKAQVKINDEISNTEYKGK